LYANFTPGRTSEVSFYPALTAFNEPVEITNGETEATCFAFEFFRGNTANESIEGGEIFDNTFG
jgi:hypothetical protein